MKFRARYWPIFLVNTTLFLTVTMLVAGLTFLVAASPIAFFAMPLVIPLGAAVSLGRKYDFPVRIGAAVIDGFNSVGDPVSIGWAGVKQVRRASLCCLPYLRISSHAHGEELWLPLLLKDFDGFADAVSHYAGEDHPLTQELNYYRWEGGSAD